MICLFKKIPPHTPLQIYFNDLTDSRERGYCFGSVRACGLDTNASLGICRYNYRCAHAEGSSREGQERVSLCRQLCRLPRQQERAFSVEEITACYSFCNTINGSCSRSEVPQWCFTRDKARCGPCPWWLAEAWPCPCSSPGCGCCIPRAALLHHGQLALICTGNPT